MNEETYSRIKVHTPTTPLQDGIGYRQDFCCRGDDSHGFYSLYDLNTSKRLYNITYSNNSKPEMEHIRNWWNNNVGFLCNLLGREILFMK